MSERREPDALPPWRHSLLRHERTARLFHERSEFHIARTRRLAASALHTGLHELDELVVDRRAVEFYTAHGIDSATWGQRFLTGDSKRRAVRQTQSARHAGRQLLGVDVEHARTLRRASVGVVHGRARAAFAAMVIFTTLLVAPSAMQTHATSAVELPPQIEIIDPALRPLGPISILGDSVLRGALNTNPNIVTELAARGWGPIRALGVPGMSSGAGGRFPPLTARFWYDRWVVEGWDPQAVVLIIGANDVGLCAHFDAACMSESIRHIVDHIGPDHDIFIPHINHFFTREWSDPYNQALDALVAQRPNLDTWAWDREVTNGTWSTADVVHLTTASYQRWSQVTAHEISKDLARSRSTGREIPLPEPIGEPAGFVPAAPTRLLDTREVAARAGPDAPVRFDLGEHVSVDATAAALYVTAARTSEPGFLTVHACGVEPGDTSHLNYAPGRARGAQVLAPLSADRDLCISTSTDVDLVVDLQGAFEPGGIGFRAAPPQRLVDTRQTGRLDVVQLDFSSDVGAVALTITAARAQQNGFVSARPCGAAPGTANLNYGAGEVIASSAYVATDDNGSVCITSSTSADLIIGVSGTFSADAPLGFQAVTPTRMIDTRRTLIWNPWHSKHDPLPVRVTPADATAVTGTVVMRRPWERGFLAAAPCTDPTAPPNTSSINADARDTIANGITSAVDSQGRLCLSTSIATHTIFDITGWWRPLG